MIRSLLRMGSRLLVVLGALLLVVWVGYGLALYVLQDRMVYPRPGGIGRDSLDAAAAEIGAVPLQLESADGVRLYGWSLRSPGSDRVVLYLHGNGETVTDYVPLYRQLRRHGFDVAVVAYRGYPGSAEVDPSEEGLAADAQALWDWAVGPGGYRPERIVVHGRSLGGGVAAILLDGPANPAGLVLESTFVSLDAVAARTAPLYPVSWLLHSHYRTYERAPRLGVPVLVLHSADDQLIPLGISARELLPTIAEAEYHETSGYSHQHCLPVSDPAIGAAYFAFLERIVPRRELAGGL